MRTIDEQHLATERGGILYDGLRVRKPAEELFEHGYWRKQDAIEVFSGGRGSVAVVRAGDERWVLRHYRRGGWASRVSQDLYLWSGAERTRAFAEWRLLAELHRKRLPVPTPIAARYVRAGLAYRADLITEYLANTRTLTQALAAGALTDEQWRRIGATVATFHRAGVHHADLNANNILLAADAERVYLLDFDRGRIRERGAWEVAVLQRLYRSLLKLKGKYDQFAFGEREWEWLLEGAA